MIELDQLLKLGLLGPVDVHFARAVARMGQETRTSVVLAAALASRAVQNGHVCLRLEAIAETDLFSQHIPEAPAGEEPATLSLKLPNLSEWVAELRSCSLVSEQPDPRSPTPLVLDEQGRLYLYRYAQYQSEVAMRILAQMRAPVQVEPKLLQTSLRRLFPTGDEDPLSDLQRLGAIAATTSPFSVISGGPGTGKTFTVSKVLALLIEQALLGRDQSQPRPPQVLLLAPTGKAAQRLAESISATVEHLDCEESVLASIPREATTLHRALGYQPRTPTRFRHNAKNPLPADIVLVDEASMVDLALMAKLLDALSPTARLILLGDKDQLASVEAGAILGDVYGSAPHRSESFVDFARSLLGDGPPAAPPPRRLGDGMVHLDKSRRYKSDSGIGELARAVNRGEPKAALAALAGSNDARLLPPTDPQLPPGGFPAPHPSLAQHLKVHFSGYLKLSPAHKLTRLNELRILSAHQRGGLGVQHLNRFAETVLSRDLGLRVETQWYRGRPILITENDHQLGLFNGDTGIIDRNPRTGNLEAYFMGAEQQLVSFAPARLPPHETVFAMTVHKSQGSEFDKVLLVLPEQASPVLTRELVYTGITRAKRDVTVYSTEPIFTLAVTRRIERASGLQDALWSAQETAQKGQ